MVVWEWLRCAAAGRRVNVFFLFVTCVRKPKNTVETAEEKEKESRALLLFLTFVIDRMLFVLEVE